MPWTNAYELCVSKEERLVYSTHSLNYEMKKEYLPLLLDDVSVTSTNVWSIHKVNNEIPKATRSYENVPYTIEYSLDDLESVLCVYFVYEDLQFRGWEADDCNNEAVVHHVLCDDDVNIIIDTAVSELTFYDEKVVWTEAKKYCEYTNTTLIGVNALLYGGNVLDDSLILNLTSLVLFWSDLSNNPNGPVVSDKPARTFGVGRLSYYEIGFELIIIPIISMSDNLELNESYTDGSNHIRAFMCEKNPERIPFLENDNSMIVNKVLLKNISEYSTVQCEEQCIALISYGIHCAGFNYNWKLQECSLLGNVEDCIILSCRDFIFSNTEGMSAFIVRPHSITRGKYKPINEPGVSTKSEIKDNDNTVPMVTDQQASTLEKKATTTKPNRLDESNAAGQVLTITMGFVSAFACSMLITKQQQY